MDQRRGTLLCIVTLGLMPVVYLGLALSRRLEGASIFVPGLELAALALLLSIPPLRRLAATRGMRQFCFGFLPIVLLISAGELTCGLYLAKKFPAKGTFSSARLSLPQYAGFAWASEVIREGTEIKYDYAPFRLWKASLYTGQYIHIDGRGIRPTFAPPAKPDARDLRVDVYGGSTVFCLEVPDEHTLPSCLARALAARFPDRKIIVRNLGVPSYNRRQELIWFEENLRAGPKPDLALFYDGANDIVFSGWMALDHKDPERFVHAMRGEESSTLELLSALFFQKTYSGTLIRTLREAPKPATKPEAAESSQPPAEDGPPPDGPRETAALYAAEANSIRSLAWGEGVACAFILQPTLYGKTGLSTWEKTFIDWENRFRPGITDFAAQFRAAVVERENSALSMDFYDMSDLFGQRTDDVYLDIFHVGARENQSLADELVKRLEPQLAEIR